MQPRYVETIVLTSRANIPTIYTPTGIGALYSHSRRNPCLIVAFSVCDIYSHTMEEAKLLEFIPDHQHDPDLVKCLLEYVDSLLLLRVLRVMKRRQKKVRKRRRCWVHPYLQRREEKGYYNNLMKELAAENPQLYRNFTRIPEELFDEIVERVTPHIKKKLTFWRRPIEPGLRVAITLRYLATGESYKSLSYQFRVAHNTICHIVPETCRAIVAVYGDEVMQVPSTPDEWKQVARGYEQRWNFPHTIGAVDGKHVRIRNPAYGGTHYFNYKKFYSVVLMAVVDADYKFRYVDVGAIGSESDGGVFAKSHLGHMLERHEINLPHPENLPNDAEHQPPLDYFFVGDDAFALRSYFMKPYPARALKHEERIFNYRLSRARRTVENAFGILANR